MPRSEAMRASWRIRAPLAFPARRRQVGADAFECLGAEPDRLGQRRMRVNGAADVDGIGAHLDRKRDLADEIPRVRADDAAADDATRLGVEEQLGEPLVAAVGDGASRRGPGKEALLDLASLCF